MSAAGQPQTGNKTAGGVVLSAPRRGMPPQHLADLEHSLRADWAQELGYPGFRAKQISTHYFAHAQIDPEKMTDLPAATRAEMVAQMLPTLLQQQDTAIADGGETIKTLFKLFDGAAIETVLMKYPDRVTMCISSQAGCGMNCPFCATGQQGLTRNLSTAEIVEQVVSGVRTLREQHPHNDSARVNNVVFMGMGEALANYRRAIAAVRRLIEPAPAGLGISARGITVSTVGLVPAMHRLAGEGLPVTLALSLHAPDDELRNTLVPINLRWSVAEVLDAAYAYFSATKRRVSIEYALIKGMNDQAWRADMLADELLARGRGWVHVNPIPLNPTPGSVWTASLPGVEQQFVERLRAAGIPTTVRDTRGSDIDGACGQLAGAQEKP